MGVDIVRFLDLTMIMVEACAACVPARENPGVMLGAILGAAGNNGRDKITLVASPGISSLGAWLEQLLAESTGKEGKGLMRWPGRTITVTTGCSSTFVLPPQRMRHRMRRSNNWRRRVIR